jgi:hypothetical protein
MKTCVSEMGSAEIWAATDGGAASIESVCAEVMCTPFLVQKSQGAHEKVYDEDEADLVITT